MSSQQTAHIDKLDDTLISLTKELTIADRTPNFEPFKEQLYPQLTQLVDHVTSLDKLRTSNDVVKLLQEIIDQCVANILVKCWKVQSIKPRLDALMKLAVPFLCTPLVTSMLNVGESWSNSTTTLDRVKKCIVEIFTFFISYELSLFGSGDGASHAVDRVDLCVALLSSKCSKYSPLAVTLREYTGPLLHCLSLHALGVTALSEDITEAIFTLRQHLCMVVLGDSQTSSSSTAMLDAFSTDVIGIQTCVLQSLTPYFTDFFSWLLNHSNHFVKICRGLEVVEYIHPSLRQSLQNEDFSSPQDVLKKYERKYKRHLTNMPLPIQLFQYDDIRQAIKDTCRETIVINSRSHEGNVLLHEVVNSLQEHHIRYLSKAKNWNGETCAGDIQQLLPIASEMNTEIQLRYKSGSSDEIGEGQSVQKNGDIEHSHLYAEYVELLSRFVLIASSRTLSSGDAYFVLNDLFGGDGLTFLPKASVDEKYKGIKIDINPLDILVECYQQYDLCSMSQISECKDMKKLVPMISFVIKVSTIFNFRKILQKYMHSIVKHDRSGENILEGLFSYLFVVLSSDPEKVYKRYLTIVPFYGQDK